jgi:CRISPR-associated protein Cas1
MPFIYITDQGATVNKKGAHLQVKNKDELLLDMLFDEVDSIVVFGGVHLTSDTALAVLDKGGCVSFMTMNGHYKGKMAGTAGKNVVARMKQYELINDPDRRLAAATGYVIAKINNGFAVLEEYHHSGSNPFDFAERDELVGLGDKVKASADLAELRGYEGYAAKLYFAGFARCLMHGRKFPGRKFHPSTDPVNAMLSFGYSFLAREFQDLLEAHDLDPFLGFYHEITCGRASLSLDIMEEFRHPMVDRLVLKLFNRKILDDDDFQTDAETGQVYLKKESLNIFLRHYEEWALEMNRTFENSKEMPWREAFRRQVEQYKKSLEQGTEYKPFSWKEKSE